MFHLLESVTDESAFPKHRGASPAASPYLAKPRAAEPLPFLCTAVGLGRGGSYSAFLCCGLLSLVLLFGFVPVGRADAQSGQTPSRSVKIANALTAAPEEIARNAAVEDWPAKEGQGLVPLRPGTNGWVCLPDDATTPGNDPMCLDAIFHEALAAYIAGQTSKPRGVGYAYMLTSDAEGSNTDPTAQRRTATNQWHHVGPHVMVLYPDPKLLEGVPTTPSASGPYVMFPGTPIAHVMLPVQSGYAHGTGHGGSNRPSEKRR
jgi:hypothetical protein